MSCSSSPFLCPSVGNSTGSTEPVSILQAPLSFSVRDRLVKVEGWRLEREREGLDPFGWGRLEFDDNDEVFSSDSGTQIDHDGELPDVLTPSQTMPLLTSPGPSHTLSACVAPSREGPSLEPLELPDQNARPVSFNAWKRPAEETFETGAQPVKKGRKAEKKAGKRMAAKTHEHEKRRVQRELARETEGRTMKTVAEKKARKALENPKVTSLDRSNVRIVETGWTGISRGRTTRQTYTLDGAKGQKGFEVIDWDGKSTKLLVVDDEYVVAVLGGGPLDDVEYGRQMSEAARATDDARGNIHFTSKESNNPRGTSAACAKGFSHGGGQTEPTNLSHSVNTDKVLEELCSLPFFARASGQANQFLKTYAPKSHEFQEENLAKLQERYPHLNFNFNDTVFAACTWNFGPQFTSYEHVDGNNYAWTWCAITAYGSFNPDHGGHLILSDLGVIIRFPPGATILIPSALLRHSNTLIRKGETRYSFVQYSAGALFRWVHQGFQTAKNWEAEATDEMWARKKQEDEERLDGWQKFSTIQELSLRWGSKS
ncbi:hypothetical protein PQX77_018408 [Marasmius sp. AFHP31]|nr:hypothetical protein PQX77_018408 [Marasmius sp. AFHP31]